MMQAFTGYVFVTMGLALALAQAVVLVANLFGIGRQVVAATSVDKVIGALIEKVPAAAVSVAFAWFGASVLGWFGA